MRLSVVGLGPGPVEWVTAAARDWLRGPGARVFARTRLHPALPALLDGVAWESFDAVYDSAASLDEVHAEIAARLVAADTDHVVFAVPGDGTLGEAVLRQLRQLDTDLQIELVPGVPLGIGALAAAGLAASDGAQLVEATSLGGSGIELQIELNPRWPAVITGIFSRQVASDVKLALLRVYGPRHIAALVRHPGLEDEAVVHVELADLDRAVLPTLTARAVSGNGDGRQHAPTPVRASLIDFDHLTHVVLPAVGLADVTGSAHGLRALVARLRAPEIGCPWDLEQTHRTLTPYVIEEAYEVVDAIEQDDMAGLADELGDLLLQVVLHAEVADQASEFELNDVLRSISAKLVRRHPHVFGEVHVSGASDVVRNWDVLKAAERADAGEPARTSALDGIPKSYPALKYASEQARKASKSGFDWPTREGTLDKVREELAELLAASSVAERREEMGDLLWIIAKLALQDGTDAEEALRGATRKFDLRFRALEAIGNERGWSAMRDQPIEELLNAWREAKQRTARIRYTLAVTFGE